MFSSPLLFQLFLWKEGNIFLSLANSLTDNINKKIRLCYASFQRCRSGIENAQQQFPCRYFQVINSLIEASYAVERKTSSSEHFTGKTEIK